MPGITTVLRVVLQLLAGVGIAEFMDKIFPSKISGYEPISPGFRPRKLLFFALAFGGGAIAWNFLNRKFHILTRRHSPRRRKSKKR